MTNPYEEQVPTLREWLSPMGFYVDSEGNIDITGHIAHIRSAHAAITEYFAKYPDAEPELRKEWEK